MPDIFLRSGAANPNDIVLNDPEAPDEGVITYEDTGGGVGILVGRGADAIDITDIGKGQGIWIGSGLDAVVISDTGSPQSIQRGSGADSIVVTDTGSPILGLFASGADEYTQEIIYEDIGGGLGVLRGSGMDVYDGGSAPEPIYNSTGGGYNYPVYGPPPRKSPQAIQREREEEEIVII